VSVAEGGHMNVLKWLSKQDFPWYAYVISETAFGGYLSVSQRQEVLCRYALRLHPFLDNRLISKLSLFLSLALFG